MADASLWDGRVLRAHEGDPGLGHPRSSNVDRVVALLDRTAAGGDIELSAGLLEEPRDPRHILARGLRPSEDSGQVVESTGCSFDIPSDVGLQVGRLSPAGGSEIQPGELTPRGDDADQLCVLLGRLEGRGRVGQGRQRLRFLLVGGSVCVGDPLFEGGCPLGNALPQLSDGFVDLGRGERALSSGPFRGLGRVLCQRRHDPQRQGGGDQRRHDGGASFHDVLLSIGSHIDNEM